MGLQEGKGVSHGLPGVVKEHLFALLPCGHKMKRVFEIRCFFGTQIVQYLLEDEINVVLALQECAISSVIGQGQYLCIALAHDLLHGDDGRLIL